MSKAEATKEALLKHGRRLFWSRGFSNVSVREVASAAGVDVALISRYFGSKLKLFEATLALIDRIEPQALPDEGALVDTIIGLFVTAPRGEEPSPVTMLLMNAGDREVGDLVRDFHRTKWQAGLEEIIGDKERAALFTAAMLGISVAEKSLHLDGIPPPNCRAYEHQFRYMLQAALSYPSRER